MKKILFTMLAIVFAVASIADDIIITKDAQRINGKIEEVGVDVLKYRRSDNPTGPIYTIHKNDISSVIYENGSVETFQVQQPAAAASVANEPAPKIESEFAPITIRDGYYFKGSKPMQYAEYLKFIEKNCPAAYKQHKQGTAMFWSSYVMLLAGVGMTTGGALSWGLAESHDSSWAAGIAVCTIGAATFITSIPLMCVGLKKRTTSHETYNRECSREEITCNLTAGTNGIGLAINF